MSANIKASVDGTRAIIGVGGVDQMTVSNAGVVTANSFVGAASSATALATGSTTARTLANRFADVVNVKDFGAVGDGIADDTAAIQAFFNFVTTNGKTGLLSEGQYKCDSGLTITLGTASFRIIGNGSESTVIFASNLFTGSKFIEIIGTGTVTQWEIGSFRIVNSGSASGKVGLTIGSPLSTTLIQGYHNSQIHDIKLSNFERLMDVVHARMIDFDRCGFWGEANTTDCTRIYQNGKFTGDLNFNSCQWVSHSNSPSKTGVRLISNFGPYSNVTGNNSLAGIRFNGCIFYSGEKAISLEAGSGSWIGQIFFTSGCQIDQETTNDIFVQCSSASSVIEDLTFDGIWMNKSTSAQMLFNSVASGKIRNVFITNTSFLQGLDAGIKIIDPIGTNCSNFTIIGNTFLDQDYIAGGCIQIEGGTHLTIAFNKAGKGLLNKFSGHLIKMFPNSSDFVIIGNDSKGITFGAVINDASGDVIKIIENNLGFNPVGESIVTVGASPFSLKNTSGYTQNIYIAGGTVSNVNINGFNVGYTGTGQLFALATGSTIVVTYTVAPSMYKRGI